MCKQGLFYSTSKLKYAVPLHFIPTINIISSKFPMIMLLHRLPPIYQVLLALAVGLFSFTVAALPSNVLHTLDTPLNPELHSKRGDNPSADNAPYVPPHLRKTPPEVATSGPQTTSTTGVNVPHHDPHLGSGPRAPPASGRGGADYGSFRKSTTTNSGTVPHSVKPVSQYPPLQGAQAAQSEYFRDPLKGRVVSYSSPAVSEPRILTVQRPKPLTGFEGYRVAKPGGRSKWGFGDSDTEPPRSQTQTLTATRYQPHPGLRTFELINAGGRRGQKPEDPEIGFPRLSMHTATHSQTWPDLKEPNTVNTAVASGTRSRTRPDSRTFEITNKERPGKKNFVTLGKNLPRPRVVGPPLPQHAKPPFTGPQVSGASPLQGLHPKSRLHKWINSSLRSERREAAHTKRTPTIFHSTVLARRTELPSNSPMSSLLKCLSPVSRLHKWMSPDPQGVRRKSEPEKETPTSDTTSSPAVPPPQAMPASPAPEVDSLQDLPPNSRLHKWIAPGRRSGGRNSPHRKRTSTTGNLPSIPSSSSKMNFLNRLLLWELSSNPMHPPAYPYRPSSTLKSNSIEKAPKGGSDGKRKLGVREEGMKTRGMGAEGPGHLHTKRTSTAMSSAHLSVSIPGYNRYAPAPWPYSQSTYGEIDPKIWGLLLQRPSNPAPYPVQHLHQYPYTQAQQLHQWPNTQVGGSARGREMGGSIRAAGMEGVGAQGGLWANLNHKQIAQHGSWGNPNLLRTPSSTNTASTSTPFSITPHRSRQPFVGPGNIPHDHLPARLATLPPLKLPGQVSPMQTPRVSPVRESRARGKPPRPEHYPKARGSIRKKQRT